MKIGERLEPIQPRTLQRGIVVAVEIIYADDVSAKLTTTDLTNLNKRALIDKEDPDKLAQGWLQDHGLM